eukprot:Lithocolla_globosa_v1_NODE_369_length_4280_cov_26.823000.p6 type:complete len:107 gc:universal NODE_369_length_4280_cov_26.823000:1578-1258(-)
MTKRPPSATLPLTSLFVLLFCFVLFVFCWLYINANLFIYLFFILRSCNHGKKVGTGLNFYLFQTKVCAWVTYGTKLMSFGLKNIPRTSIWNRIGPSKLVESVCSTV